MVDTSVVAALVFQEPRAAEADQLLSDHQLHAPPLLAYELTQVALKKARADSAVQEILLQQLERGLSIGIRWHDITYSRVCRLALGTGLSSYDASYLFLSRALRIPLLTFDQQLAIAAARP